MTKGDNLIIDAIRWAVTRVSALLAGLVLLMGAGIGVWYAYDWWANGRHLNRIEVVFEVPPKVDNKCEGSSPSAFVGIVNHSKRTIEKVWITVSARLPERSTDILAGGSIFYDRIVEPNEGYAQCWNFKVKTPHVNEPDLGNAIFKGRIIRVDFSE